MGGGEGGGGGREGRTTTLMLNETPIYMGIQFCIKANFTYGNIFVLDERADPGQNYRPATNMHYNSLL